MKISEAMNQEASLVGIWQKRMGADESKWELMATCDDRKKIWIC